jgi:hypothetical protein
METNEIKTGFENLDSLVSFDDVPDDGGDGSQNGEYQTEGGDTGDGGTGTGNDGGTGGTSGETGDDGGTKGTSGETGDDGGTEGTSGETGDDGGTKETSGGNDSGLPDIISDVLKAKGFRNGKVRVEEEDGSVAERDFSELSREEQLFILTQSPEDAHDEVIEIPEGFLTADEAGFIAGLREDGITVTDYVEVLQAAVRSNREAEKRIEANGGYEVDKLGDDDAYLALLRLKFPKFTEDELHAELLHDKSDPERFAKMVQVAREEAILSERAKTTAAMEAERVESAKNIRSYLDKNPYVGFVKLNDEEKTDIVDIVYKKESDGTTRFEKLQANPANQVMMAWFMKYGPIFFRQMTDEMRNLQKQVPKPAKSDKTPDKAGKGAPKPAVSRSPNETRPATPNDPFGGLDRLVV